MAITASDWLSLRRDIQNLLIREIPEDLPSSDKRFAGLTGMTQKWLEGEWEKGKITTSCNSFAGVMVRKFGLPAKSILTKGVLDISKAEREVPGCWQEANSQEACLENLTPHAGDLYSGPYKGKINGKEWTQKWGHVGIVYDYEPDTGNWWLVQGGQGGPKVGVDWIKWKYAKFDRTKLNGWVDMARYMLPEGPYAIDDADDPRPRPTYQY